MARIKNVDMLHGNLFKAIITFAVPLLFIALIQNLFNAVDIMVLGYMADTNAVAAVGTTGSIVNLLVNVAIGISSGAKIILARLMGEGEEEKTSRTVYTSVVTALGLGLAVAVLGVSLSGVFLKLVACPVDIYDDALIYLRLYFAAAPAILLYNFGSNIIQVSGDSQRPLYYMIASGLLNVGLNILLCIVLPNKVAAVAIATAASQVLGAILVMHRVFTMEESCRLRLDRRLWSTPILRKMMVNGLPIGLSSALYPIANLQIQSAINAYGAAAIAGNSAMSSIETIESAIVSTPWNTAAGVFVSKNIGADNKKRVKHSMLICIAIGCTLAVIFSGIVLLASGPLLSLYVGKDAAAIAYGQIRMKYVAGPYVIAVLNGILATAIQSFGYSIFCTLNSVVSVLLFRAFWMYFIYPFSTTFDTLMLCFLVSWCLVTVVYLTFYFYVYYRKFKKNKLKKMG